MATRKEQDFDVAPSLVACDDNDTVLRTLVYSKRRHVEQPYVYFSFFFFFLFSFLSFGSTCLSAVSSSREHCTFGCTATLELLLVTQLGKTFALPTRGYIVSQLPYIARHFPPFTETRSEDVSLSFVLRYVVCVYACMRVSPGRYRAFRNVNLSSRNENVISNATTCVRYSTIVSNAIAFLRRYCAARVLRSRKKLRTSTFYAVTVVESSSAWKVRHRSGKVTRCLDLDVS